ncbi:MAG: RdgB/HAM1 family non-canonical purine NTP pyrophosphatase [Saprospiraceae bacterium]|nr:RdgB/HAM1 family non-canonical purine NTP pyrophosphatase [Saprospiraceae bacterium]
MNIVFATNNKNKVVEIQQLLPETIKIQTLSEIGCFDNLPETMPTISENAIQKAAFVATKYNCICFAEDSGLEIDALFGDPGVRSARYASEHKDDGANIEKVLDNLKNETKRSARFRTVIAYINAEETVLFEGVCEGTIMSKKIGTAGFGYDSIFQPVGFEKTFAQMDISEKNEISHRALAMRGFLKFLSAQINKKHV